jgi:TetR/AcrR family transcriptional regulator, lmrAB and yxaGH operons repressor
MAGRKADAERQRAVTHSMSAVFQRGGYDGASLSSLGAVTGLAKASLYHRFPGGKPDMGRAVLADAGRRFADLVLRPLQMEAPPTLRLRHMLDGLASYYAGADSCLMNALTLGDGADLFGKDIRLTINAWVKLMASALEEMGHSPDAARDEADDIVCRVQGALVLARLGDRPDALSSALARIRAGL